MLYVFQLAFSSQERRNITFKMVEDWPAYSKSLPEDINEFDWLIFQQEYRDYLDLAKLVQLIPIIGAPVGAIVNYNLLDTLGDTAKNAYRLRRNQTGEA
jgi:membrane protein required for beta-lactamase induction